MRTDPHLKRRVRTKNWGSESGISNNSSDDSQREETLISCLFVICYAGFLLVEIYLCVMISNLRC